MSIKTEILLTEEIKQSNIETRIYDGFAQFYDWGEAVETEIIAENENRSAKRYFLTASLAIIGGLFLFGSLAVGAFYISEKMFQTETINQIGVKNLPTGENSDDSFGEGRTAENGLEAEKTLKAKVSEDKNLADNFVKKETLNPTETNLRKTIEKNDKLSSPVQITKESPKTTELSSKTTNSSKPSAAKDPKREFWTSSPTDKTSQNSPTSDQIQKDPIKPSRSEKFQDPSKTKQERIVKKIKQSNPEQRSNIRERLAQQRRKN